MRTKTVLQLARRAGLPYSHLDADYCRAVQLPLDTVGTIEVPFSVLVNFAKLVVAYDRASSAARARD